MFLSQRILFNKAIPVNPRAYFLKYKTFNPIVISALFSNQVQSSVPYEYALRNFYLFNFCSS